MSQNLPASTSRISRADAPLFRTPDTRPMLSSSTSTVGSGSALGKRGAAEAGLEDVDGMKKTINIQKQKMVGLDRQISELKAKAAASQSGFEELRLENERLRSERTVLADGESREKATGQERERLAAEEKIRLNSTVSELRKRNDRLDDKLAEVQSQHDTVAGRLALLTQERNQSNSIYEGRIKELEADVDSLKGWKRRAEALSIDLEEQKRMMGEMRQGRGDEGNRDDDVLRKELRRQSQQFLHRHQEAEQLKVEVNELRAYKKQSDGAHAAQREVERDLRERIRTLEDQVSRSRKDMDSLTQTFHTSTSSPSSPAPDAETLRSRLASLSAMHQATTSEVIQKDHKIRELEARLSKQNDSSKMALADLAKRATEAERELRWAREARDTAENQEKFAKRLLEEVSAAKSTGMPGGGDFGDQGVRLEQLQKQVEMYKAEMAAIARDSRELEDRITQGAGLVAQSALDEAIARVDTLQAEITALHSTISDLTAANTTLDAEVNDLMRRVASGEYNPATERCIEFVNNPAAKEKTIRRAEIDELRAENEALLEELKDLEDAKQLSEGKRYVPRESWERERKEKEKMQDAHAKRLQRLKEIFGMKSKEFLEAVYSLLGWRIKFDESGADIRLTSMYAPKGKMGLTLKFASQEGHFGTMQMTGAMAKGLEEARHFWIVERQSVPGFLAQVTTECFEKTTIGRAAGYVGLE